MSDERRIVAWFSCGAASAVAASLVPEAVVARCIVDNEHEDNSRFAVDVGQWLGREIVDLRSDRYTDCWDVWEKRRYLNGPKGALCTVELKKRVRVEFSRLDDVHVFGFTSEEQDRAERFEDNNPEVSVRFPLIEHGLTKRHCFERIQDAGIALPAMYALGYHNANCVGCVKGGQGYWNKIRRDFPETFERMAALEERIGASCINRQPLRTLRPDAGRHSDLVLPDCGLFCGENGGWA